MSKDKDTPNLQLVGGADTAPAPVDYSRTYRISYTDASDNELTKEVTGVLNMNALLLSVVDNQEVPDSSLPMCPAFMIPMNSLVALEQI